MCTFSQRNILDIYKQWRQTHGMFEFRKIKQSSPPW